MTDLIYAALCILFLATIPLDPFWGQETLKAAPILLLAFLVWRSPLERRFKRSLVPAFLFSAAGDVFLHLHHMPMSFMLGLGSFLIGHLFLIATNVRWPEFEIRKMFVASLVGVFLVIMMTAVRPGASAEGLFIPVLVYGGVLTTMAVTSLFATHGWLLGVGGLLFVVSDSLIAWRKFVQPLPASGYATMLTYYLAQFLMWKAYLASARRAS